MIIKNGYNYLIMLIKVSLSSEQVSRILSLSTLLMLLPFASADLAIVYGSNSGCFRDGIKSVGINPFSWLLLGQWLKTDGFIKLGILALWIFFLRVRVETKANKLFLPAFANLLTLFWIFNIAWNVAGGVMYWENVDFKTCTSTVTSYMPAVLIINYIFCPIGLILSRLRPTFDENEDTIGDAPGDSGRRDT